MKKIYWFGDSWVAGDELEMLVPDKEKYKYTFAQLVSNELEYECVNLGTSGSSIDDIAFEFSGIVSDLTPDDIVIFCLTASHRITILGDEGERFQLRASDLENHNNLLHPYTEQWYKYFDTQPQRKYNYDQNINLLHLWCKSIGVKHVFANLFSIEDKSEFDIVPSSCWLTPREQCLAQLFNNPLFDTKGMINADGPSITSKDWEYQIERLAEYIRPCLGHPNIKGHITIANFIVKQLTAQVL